jgi:hypothetical protein
VIKIRAPPEDPPLTPKDSKLNAIGHWLIEISALLTVFPWLDQVIHLEKPFSWHLFGWTIALALILLGGGLLLIRER